MASTLRLNVMFDSVQCSSGHIVCGTADVQSVDSCPVCSANISQRTQVHVNSNTIFSNLMDHFTEEQKSSLIKLTADICPNKDVTEFNPEAQTSFEDACPVESSETASVELEEPPIIEADNTSPSHARMSNVEYVRNHIIRKLQSILSQLQMDNSCGSDYKLKQINAAKESLEVILGVINSRLGYNVDDIRSSRRNLCLCDRSPNQSQISLLVDNLLKNPSSYSKESMSTSQRSLTSASSQTIAPNTARPLERQIESDGEAQQALGLHERKSISICNYVQHYEVVYAYHLLFSMASVENEEELEYVESECSEQPEDSISQIEICEGKSDTATSVENVEKECVTLTMTVSCSKDEENEPLDSPNLEVMETENISCPQTLLSSIIENKHVQLEIKSLFQSVLENISDEPTTEKDKVSRGSNTSSLHMQKSKPRIFTSKTMKKKRRRTSIAIENRRTKLRKSTGKNSKNQKHEDRKDTPSTINSITSSTNSESNRETIPMAQTGTNEVKMKDSQDDDSDNVLNISEQVKFEPKSKASAALSTGKRSSLRKPAPNDKGPSSFVEIYHYTEAATSDVSDTALYGHIQTVFNEAPSLEGGDVGVQHQNAPKDITTNSVGKEAKAPTVAVNGKRKSTTCTRKTLTSFKKGGMRRSTVTDCENDEPLGSSNDSHLQTPEDSPVSNMTLGTFRDICKPTCWDSISSTDSLSEVDSVFNKTIERTVSKTSQEGVKKLLLPRLKKAIRNTSLDGDENITNIEEQAHGRNKMKSGKATTHNSANKKLNRSKVMKKVALAPCNVLPTESVDTDFMQLKIKDNDNKIITLNMKLTQADSPSFVANTSLAAPVDSSPKALKNLKKVTETKTQQMANEPNAELKSFKNMLTSEGNCATGKKTEALSDKKLQPVPQPFKKSVIAKAAETASLVGPNVLAKKASDPKTVVENNAQATADFPPLIKQFFLNQCLSAQQAKKNTSDVVNEPKNAKPTKLEATEEMGSPLKAKKALGSKDSNVASCDNLNKAALSQKSVVCPISKCCKTYMISTCAEHLFSEHRQIPRITTELGQEIVIHFNPQVPVNDNKNYCIYSVFVRSKLKSSGYGDYKDMIPVMIMIKRTTSPALLKPSFGSTKSYIIWVTSIPVQKKMFYTMSACTCDGFYKMNMGEVIDMRDPQDHNLLKREVFFLSENDVNILTNKGLNVISMKLKIH